VSDVADLSVSQSLNLLREAIEAASGRVDETLLNPARTVLRRAGQRLALAGPVTVVALAGATGAGKSSLFNVLSRTALAETGVRRPITSEAMSMTFGSTDTDELLAWLEVPRRHSVPGRDLRDLVLIDLPDYDSTVQRHRDEVDRMIELVDVVLWVVDPQKYADAALHDRYLIPMASHAETMIFVLNQIDRIRPEQIDRIRADLAHLLAGEGITGVDIHAVSAATGQGVDQLRRALREVAARKRAVAARLLADVAAAARRLRTAVSPNLVAPLSEPAIADLDRAMEAAAGVDEVAQAVGASWRYRGQVATGWPPANWIRRLRPDPLKRLNLAPAGHQPVDGGSSPDSGAKEASDRPREAGRTSVRAWRSVPAARVDTALRGLDDDSIRRLPPSWRQAVQRAARSQETVLPARLDRTVGSADLGLDHRPGWWSGAKVVQLVCFWTLLVSLLWLGYDALAQVRGWPAPPLPNLGPLPWPAWLALGGLVVGLGLAFLARAAVVSQARAKQTRAVSTLRQAVAQVTREAVVAPVNDELVRHNQASQALRALFSR
jgi:GTP-binding protein EngB required for normal cell division